MPRVDFVSPTLNGVSLHTKLSAPSTPESRLTLVLLHFWGGSNGTYEPLIAQLEEDHNIVAPSLRGWGESSKPANPEAYSVVDHAADITALLHHLSQEKPWLLSQGIVYIGHSMGGKIAQYLASSSKPDIQVRGLVLLAPAPLGTFALPQAMREQQLHAYDDVESATFVVQNVLLGLRDGVPSSAIARLAGDAFNGSTEAKHAWPGYGMAEDYEHLMSSKLSYTSDGSTPRKILVIVGELDQVETPANVNLRVVEPLRKSGADVRIEVLESIGHLIPAEAPRSSARLISNFLKGL